MISEEELKEITSSYARLTDVIYSAGMDEESEELQEIWNRLISTIEGLTEALDGTQMSLADTIAERNDLQKEVEQLKVIRSQAVSVMGEVGESVEQLTQQVETYRKAITQAISAWEGMQDFDDPVNTVQTMINTLNDSLSHK